MIFLFRSALFVFCLGLAASPLAGECWNDIPPDNPDHIYVDHGDGTVTDTRTGLMWKQCVEGLSVGDCIIPSDDLFSWDNALVHAESSTFAGYTDWRLPNIQELRSLVEHCSASAINESLFPNNKASEVWTSSPTAFSTNSAWVVDFVSGRTSHIPRIATDRMVRLVRTAASFSSPALSCTTNTLGLPLDSTSCFYDAGDTWKTAVLKQAGVEVARASLAGNEGGFCANSLFWITPVGTPVTNWSGLFGGGNTASVEISIERPDNSTRVLGSLTATRSQFEVEVTANQTFPMSGPQAAATFTAAPGGGTGPYTYNWAKVMDYVIDGYGYQSWGSSASASIELPAYGEKYPSYPARWGSFNSLHPILLQVTDSGGQVANVQCLAAVTAPPLTGNPSQNGGGSQLLRGVDVASGNYHWSDTDLSVTGKGPDFVLTRSYNSNPDKGGAWAFNLDMRAWFGSHGMGREITIGPREDGRKQHFYRELDGTWRSLNPGNFDALKQNPDGSLVLYTQGNLLYRFADPEGASDGRLESIEDRDGNVLAFSHAANRITGATDASGRAYSVTRNGDGRITRVTDFTGRYVEFTWNGGGMITAARNPRGHSVTYGYSGTNLTSITDARGNLQATIAYHASGAQAGKVSSVTDGAGNAWGYTYGTDAGRQATAVTRPSVNGVNHNLGFYLDDARTRVVETVDSMNNSRRTAFKSTTSRARIAELGLAAETYRPSNAKTTIDYTDDGQGNPSKITDALNRETLSTYGTVAGQTNLTPRTTIRRPGVAAATRYADFTDGGKARTIIDALDQTRARAYSGGLLASSTDARGGTTAYQYDAHGRPTRVTNALGHYTESTYDALGRVVSERNARGHVTTYTYDANGNVLTVSNPAGGVTTHVYDASDNLVSTTDPRGNTTTYVYDNLNRKIEERYTAGGQQRTRAFAYDAMGRLYRVTNEKGHSSETRFDARGNTLQEINPLSQTVTYTYDANGNLLSETDAEGRAVTYQYDALDRKTRATDALDNYEAYTYNAQGLLASKRDARGQITQYEYDALGRMTKVIDADGEETLAGYDANGNLTSTTDRKGQTVNYQYDALNRMTRLTDAENRQSTFVYDANGNLTSRTMPSGQTTSYTYDNLDRVSSVAYPGGPTVSFTYDANGNRLTMTDGNGTTQYSYDEQNRLTAMTDAFGNPVAWRYDAAGLMDRLTYPGNRDVTYSFDAAGHMTNLADWLGHTTTYTRDASGAITAIQYGNGARVQKIYDNAGRLVSLVNRNASNAVISSHGLTLDGAGNPLSATLDLPLLPANFGKSAEMLYDASNRLTSVGGVAVSHDTDGRLTSDPSGADPIQYAYNAHDLITTASRAGQVTDTYLYDGDGRRVARTSNGQATRYVLDPTGGDLYRLLAETDTSNAVQQYYVYGDDGLVSQISGSSHRYYHFDQTGNTLALTDSSGTVTDTYAYEPFGNTTAQGSSHNPFRFVGKYGVMDDGNGLHHMRARYYRPDLRRFVSLDALYGEIDDPMTLNRYQYVSGNPMVGVDPSGMNCTGAGSTMGSSCLQNENHGDSPVKFDWKVYDEAAGFRIFNTEAKIATEGDYLQVKAGASLFVQVEGDWVELKLPSAELKGCGQLKTPSTVVLDIKVEVCKGISTPSGPSLLLKMSENNGPIGIGLSGDVGVVSIKGQLGVNMEPLVQSKPVKEYFGFEKLLRSDPASIVWRIRRAFGR